MKIQKKFWPFYLLLFCLIPLSIYSKQVFNTEHLQMDRVSKIETILSKSQIAIQKKEWKKANSLLKKGITTLGDKYVGNNMADDTEMKLLAADDQEKKGALENAAIVRQRILGIRLDLYKQKLRLQ